MRSDGVESGQPHGGEHGRIVAVQHATARRLGRVLDVTACQLIRMSGGVIAEMRGHYSDEAALSSFWH